MTLSKGDRKGHKNGEGEKSIGGIADPEKGRNLRDEERKRTRFTMIEARSLLCAKNRSNPQGVVDKGKEKRRNLRRLVSPKGHPRPGGFLKLRAE